MFDYTYLVALFVFFFSLYFLKHFLLHKPSYTIILNSEWSYYETVEFLGRLLEVGDVVFDDDTVQRIIRMLITQKSPGAVPITFNY